MVEESKLKRSNLRQHILAYGSWLNTRASKIFVETLL